MRRSAVAFVTVVLCALSAAPACLGAPTILPGPLPGSVAGIEDLEVGSGLYNVTFRWDWAQAVWGLPVTGATFYGNPADAVLAGSAIDEVLNTPSVAASVYDSTNGADSTGYAIVHGQTSGWIILDMHRNVGTWSMTHQGWGMGFRGYQMWAVFTFVDNVSPTDPPPGNTVPAPGALLLGGIGAGLVTWLRRRRAL